MKGTVKSACHVRGTKEIRLVRLFLLLCNTGKLTLGHHNMRPTLTRTLETGYVLRISINGKNLCFGTFCFLTWRKRKRACFYIKCTWKIAHYTSMSMQHAFGVFVSLDQRRRLKGTRQREQSFWAAFTLSWIRINPGYLECPSYGFH